MPMVEFRRRRSLPLMLAISYLIIGTLLLIFRQNLAIWLFKDSARTDGLVAIGTGILLIGISVVFCTSIFEAVLIFLS
jgi:hypothetical protein